MSARHARERQNHEHRAQDRCPRTGGYEYRRGQRSTAAQLTPARLEEIVRGIVGAVVEMAGGVHSYEASLGRWVTPEIQARMIERFRLAAQVRATWEQMIPGPTARPPVMLVNFTHTRIRRVRIQQITPTAWEAAAVVTSTGRARAVALRIEATDEKGVEVTVLQIG